MIPDVAAEVVRKGPLVVLAELQDDPTPLLLDFVFAGLPEVTITGDTINLNVPLATNLEALAPEATPWFVCERACTQRPAQLLAGS